MAGQCLDIKVISWFHCHKHLLQFQKDQLTILLKSYFVSNFEGYSGFQQQTELQFQPSVKWLKTQAFFWFGNKSRQQGELAERGNQKAASASAEQVHTTVKYLDLDALPLAGGVASSALLMVWSAWRSVAGYCGYPRGRLRSEESENLWRAVGPNKSEAISLLCPLPQTSGIHSAHWSSLELIEVYMHTHLIGISLRFQQKTWQKIFANLRKFHKKVSQWSRYSVKWQKRSWTRIRHKNQKIFKLNTQNFDEPKLLKCGLM